MTKEELITSILNASIEISRLTKERDEARREVCRLLDKDSEFRVSNETTAKRKGWDCYASDTLSQEVSQDVSLRKGLKQAKEGKFSKNPPKIKQKTKKDKPIKKSIKKETTYKILGSPKTMSAFKQMLGYPTKKKKTK